MTIKIYLKGKEEPIIVDSTKLNELF